MGGTTILTDAGAAEIEGLKQRPGGPTVILGSSGLMQTLLGQRLIDEFQIWIHPVILGDGKRLFRQAPATTLQLVESRTTTDGLIIATYAAAGSGE